MAIIPVSYEGPDPSSHMIDLQVCSYGSDKYVRERGQLDTGAYVTFIPDRLVSELSLQPIGYMPIVGLYGGKMHDVYNVGISIDGGLTAWHSAAALWGHDRLLIGRDLLNLWKIALDGPSLRGQVDAPAAPPVRGIKS